jgi:hypothetical protein
MAKITKKTLLTIVIAFIMVFILIVLQGKADKLAYQKYKLQKKYNFVKSRYTLIATQLQQFTLLNNITYQIHKRHLNLVRDSIPKIIIIKHAQGD